MRRISAFTIALALALSGVHAYAEEKPKKESDDPKNQVQGVAGATEKGAAAGVTASFELPADSGLDVTALAGESLFRVHIGAQVIPVKVIKKEIPTKDGTVKYELAFVPSGEFHMDVTSFKEAPDLHAFVTPSMESTIEFEGKTYKSALKFLMSPAAMGAIRTDSGVVTTFGGQTGIGVSFTFKVSPVTTVTAAVEGSIFRGWMGDSVHGFDLDAVLQYQRRLGGGQYFTAGPVAQYEMLRIEKAAGENLDYDQKYFVGIGAGFAWSSGP